MGQLIGIKMKKIIALVLLLIANLAFASADWPRENISQAVFAKSVEDRVPIEVVTQIDNSQNKIYFFTNIRYLTGDRITHRWIFKDRVKAEVSFDIDGERWRVWSSKNLWHTWTGPWTVEVVNREGEVLLTKTFEFTQQ